MLDVAALNPGLALPAHTTSTSNVILECAQFLSFVTWGPVKRADIYLGEKKAASVPLQVMADPAYPVIPTSCASAGPVATGVSDQDRPRLPDGIGRIC